MINHVRTLLLNMDGSKTYATDHPGEEFVDPDYKSLVLPRPLRLIRDCLFGASADRAMLNYRLRQLLSLVHACELSEFAASLDSRITYWPVHLTDTFDQSVFGTKVTATAGDGILYAHGTVNFLAISQLIYQWQITVNNNGTVTVAQQTDPMVTVNYGYTLTNGLSQELPLIGTPQTFSFTGNPGDQWLVQTVARPLYGLPTVLRTVEQGMTDEVYTALFGGFGRTEPYTTFSNLWLYHPEVAYRLGAVVLALAYRCDEIRKG